MHSLKIIQGITLPSLFICFSHVYPFIQSSGFGLFFRELFVRLLIILYYIKAKVNSNLHFLTINKGVLYVLFSSTLNCIFVCVFPFSTGGFLQAKNL
jgi:hypothetical protein